MKPQRTEHQCTEVIDEVEVQRREDTQTHRNEKYKEGSYKYNLNPRWYIRS